MEKKLTLTYGFIMLVSFLFLLWRSRYGFANTDETFYLTVPYRICQGDKLLIHEWHVTQLSGLLLVPLMKIWLALFSGMEGSLLAFRYCFTVVWWLASLFLFFRLKKVSKLGSSFASLIFLFYAPYGIPALSYNSLGLLLFLASCILITTSEHRKGLQGFAAGVLLSGSVLCCPYLAFLWIACTVLAFAGIFRNRQWFRQWLYVSFGIAASFLCFCVYLFISAPLNQYLKTLPMILDDPEHPMISWFVKWKLIIYYARQLDEYWLSFLIVAAVVGLLAKSSGLHAAGFVIMCALISAMLLSYRGRYHISNFSMFPLSILGLYCWFCSDDPVIKRLFYGIWIPGLGFALCNCLSSNQAYFTFSGAATVMTLVSVVIGAEYVCHSMEKENAGNNMKLAVVFCAFVITACIQIGCEISDRYENVFWDGENGLKNQTEYVEHGPEKGLWVNWDVFDFYTKTEKDMALVRNDDAVERVLILSRNTWHYLSAEKAISSYSAWLSGVNDYSMHRLSQYYRMFPEKKPDMICIDRDYIEYIPQLQQKGYYLSDEETSEYIYIMKR